MVSKAKAFGPSTRPALAGPAGHVLATSEEGPKALAFDTMKAPDHARTSLKKTYHGKTIK